MPFVTSAGIRIHYAVEGQGPNLVLQHGFFGSLEDWYEYGYVDAWKERFRLILVDARGHGRSDKPHDPKLYTRDLRAQDVVSVLDALKVERSHFLGFSMGGWIAFGLMEQHSQRFASYVVVAAHPYQQDLTGLREAVRTLEDWVPQSHNAEGAKRRFLANDRQALLAAAEDRPDLCAAIRELSVPCLMIDGEHDEIFEKVRRASSLSECIEFASVPGADHVGSLSRCDLIAPLVEAFLLRTRGAATR